MHFHYVTHIKVKLIDCIETFLNAPLPARLAISTASDAALSLAGVWIKECWEAHPKCKATTPSSNGPTRLLDLGSPRKPLSKVRLVLVNQAQRSVPYVALSYCWGPPPGSAFKLTTTTLNSLSQGIMVSQFPRTIQDAIHICRKFGFQYLWVDSVCIMQDDPKAWRYESEKMGSIYQGSAISIAALYAEDNSGGCFAKREPLKNISLHFPPRATHILSSHIMNDGHQEEIQFSKFWIRSRQKYTYPDQLDGGSLRTRGWAFQELLLAPRTLYFGSHGIYWECRQARRNDLFPRGVPEMSSENWDSPLGIGRHFKKLLFKLGVLDSSISHELRRRWFNAAWQEIVKYYSGLKLTYSTDKLAAIAGIVEFVKAAHRTLARGVVNYSAGVWAFDFSEQLLWYLPKQKIEDETEKVSRRQITSIALSFSWAYADVQVEYPPASPQYLSTVAHDVLHGPDLLTRVTQTGSNLEESSHKRSEACLVGYYLQVCGPVSRVYPKRFVDARYRQTKYLNDNSVYMISLDFKEDAEAIFDEILFLSFIRWSTVVIRDPEKRLEPDEFRELRGLLLVPVSVEGRKSTFRRIGYFVEGLSEGHLANKLFEDEGPDETLTIV